MQYVMFTSYYFYSNIKANFYAYGYKLYSYVTPC